MKFLANENFPITSVKILRDQGYDIISVSENNRSIKDFEVMQVAIEEDRTILTFDRDYGELVFKTGYKPAAGVIYFRIESFQPRDPADWLMTLVEDNQLTLEGMFTVYQSEKIRQRKI